MPRRHMIYRNIRGATKYCGWKYFWAESHCHEQRQSGNTYKHLFGPIPLDPWDHVWYYLFSMMTAPPLEHQGPLIHVPPPELPMPSARIFHSANQNIPGMTPTFLTFDSVAWDDYNFYDPAQPDRLTIPAGALYSFGACANFFIPVLHGARLAITLNGTDDLIRHQHSLPTDTLVGSVLSIHTLWPLRPGDFLQVRVLQTAMAGADILARDNYSPHFWITLVGPYPT
ncbi:hypothetical protein ES708_29955 [subsurface metagenome]